MKYLRSYQDYKAFYHPKYDERNYPLIGIMCFDNKQHGPVFSYSVKQKIENETRNSEQVIQILKNRRNINIMPEYDDIRSAELTRRQGLAGTHIGDNKYRSLSGAASSYLISRVNYTVIAKGEYRAASAITDLYFPHNSSLERIDYGAFADSALMNVNLPDSLEIIGPKAFMNTRIQSIRIPNNVTDIGKYAFYGCELLENLDLGGGDFYFTPGDEDNWDTGRRIHWGAFSRCFSLRNVVIPSGVTSVARSAFASCKNLEYVYLGEHVKHIGVGAFQGCSNLNRIVVSPDNPHFFVDENGILLRKGKRRGKNVYVSFIPISKKNINMCYSGGTAGVSFGHRVFNGMEIDSLKVKSNKFVIFKSGAFGEISYHVGSSTLGHFHSEERLATIKELIIDGFPKKIKFGYGTFSNSGLKRVRITVSDDTELSCQLDTFINCNGLETVEVVCATQSVFDRICQELDYSGINTRVTQYVWIKSNE